MRPGSSSCWLTNATESRFPPDISGAASRVTRRTARTQGSTILSQQAFQVVLETPEGLRTFECGVEEYILDAAARNGIPLPSICRQGWCLTCSGRLISGV